MVEEFAVGDEVTDYLGGFGVEEEDFGASADR